MPHFAHPFCQWTFVAFSVGAILNNAEMNIVTCHLMNRHIANILF